MLGTPDDVHRVNDLHLPVDEEILVELKSQDVLHSFFLPQSARQARRRARHEAFRLVPGQQDGHLRLVCAELCGWGHYKMKGRMTVEAASDFDAWLDQTWRPSRTTAVSSSRPATRTKQRMSYALKQSPSPRRRFHECDHGPTRTDMSVGAFRLRTYVFSLDHKIIGIQFLFSTLLWFVVGGLLALGVRWQLAWPWTRHADRRPDAVRGRRGADLARVLHDALHDARHGDDLLRDHSDSGGCVRQLPDSADDRRRRHGVSDAEHAQLLVHVAGVRLHRIELLRRPAGPAGGWTAYPPLSVVSRGGARQPTGADAVAAGRHVRRRLVDDGLGQLHDDDHQDAGARHDDVPHADDDLGACSSPPSCRPSRCRC